MSRRVQSGQPERKASDNRHFLLPLEGSLEASSVRLVYANVDTPTHLRPSQAPAQAQGGRELLEGHLRTLVVALVSHTHLCTHFAGSVGEMCGKVHTCMGRLVIGQHLPLRSEAQRAQAMDDTVVTQYQLAGRKNNNHCAEVPVEREGQHTI